MIYKSDLLEVYYLFWRIGYLFKSVGGDDVGVLDTYGADSRHYKFGFESQDIMLGEYIAATWSYYRQFVDLDSDSIAYEASFLGISHKMAFESGCTHYFYGTCIHI